MEEKNITEKSIFKEDEAAMRPAGANAEAPTNDARMAIARNIYRRKTNKKYKKIRKGRVKHDQKSKNNETKNVPWLTYD